MYGKYFDVCMDIAENLSGAHNYWIAEGPLSYITLNRGELVFTSTQEKFQVLDQPPVKWNENHFINMKETGKRLAGEILEQVREFEREGKAFISIEEWFAEIKVHQSKMREWEQQIWVDDIEKLEIERWASFLETQENPIFQDFAVFLDCHLDDYKSEEKLQEKPHFRELLESEIAAANKLADFLANHSNDLLREGAYWIPQWVAAH